MGTQTAADDFDESETEKDPQQPLSAATNEETSSQDAGLKATEDMSESEEDDGDDAPKVLTTEEVEKELTSEAFSSFLNVASKKVERASGSDLLANLRWYRGRTRRVVWWILSDGLQQEVRLTDGLRLQEVLKFNR